MTKPIMRIHNEFWESFHPEHRADLLNSGLSVETVKSAGIYSARPGDISKLLKFNPKGVNSALVFPYPNDPDFCRIKCFPPAVSSKGHTSRYLQPRQSGVRLYIPPFAAAVLNDPAISLAWTEGEKKALKACQEGIPCIGLGGLWNFVEGNRGVPGLDDIAHVNRQERFYPDADVWARPDLLKAVYAFVRELEARGAQPLTGLMPMTPGVQKLDDFLQQRPPEALEELRHVPRTHKVFSNLAKWWQGWRGKKLGGDSPKSSPSPLKVARIVSDRQKIISCQHNALIWLQEQGYNTKVSLDTFRQLIMVDRQPLSDELVIEMVRLIEASTLVRWAEGHLRSAMVSLGIRQPSSSLTAWLDSLTWDRKHRIVDFFTEMYGTPASEYTSACAEILFLSAVARAYQPGCQADVMVVLIGDQGIGKSKGIADLVPDFAWYTDDLGGDLYDKKAGEGLQGKWLIEFSEFVRINRATTDVVKSFLSRRVDHYRPAYGHLAKDFPRQCIFIGTTNNPLPLQDLENRRFMPVRCPREVGDIARIREQLWAEAVARYKAGDPWWVTDHRLQQTVKDEQDAARQHDEWEDILRDELRNLPIVTLREVSSRLGITKDRLDKSTQIRLGLAMKSIGFIRKREAVGSRPYYWERDGPS